MDLTILRGSEAVFRSDDVQFFQTEGRIIVMTQDNIALGCTRTVDALIVLEDVLGAKINATALFVVYLAITTLQFKLQPARVDLPVMTILVVWLMSQLSSLNVTLPRFVEVRGWLIES